MKMTTIQIIALLLIIAILSASSLWTIFWQIPTLSKNTQPLSKVQPKIIKCPPVNRSALLLAIATVESGNNPHAVGRKGERTRYQILPATWRLFSVAPLRTANDREIERVAGKILDEITEELQRRNIPVDVFQLAIRWNMGTRIRHFTPEGQDYAKRVENLCGL